MKPFLNLTSFYAGSATMPVAIQPEHIAHVAPRMVRAADGDFNESGCYITMTGGSEDDRVYWVTQPFAHVMEILGSLVSR